MKRTVILIVLLAVGFTAWYGYYQYNRKNKDLADVQTDFSVDAGSLLAEFSKDTAVANRKYINKIIAVSGPVKQLDTSGRPAVILLGNGGISSVKCSMDPSHTLSYQNIRSGEKLTIKGVCAGGTTDSMFGTDVVITFGVLQKERKDL